MLADRPQEDQRVIDGLVNTTRTLIAFALIMATAAAAAAQPRPGGWEITLDAGWQRASSAASAPATLSAGTPFTTVVGLPSRRVATWFGGDGAQLLNSVLTQLGVPAASRIAPIDGSAGDLLGGSEAGANVGIRLARRLSSRFSIEGAVDVTVPATHMSSDARAAIEATRASFATALGALVASGPFTNAQIASVADVEEGSLRQVFTSGRIVFDLTPQGAVVPYLTAGTGVLSTIGTPPSVTLQGRSAFTISGTSASIAQNDTLIVTSRAPAAVAVLAGAGARIGSARWGLRVEVRARIAREERETTIEARPSAETGSPADTIASYTTPSLQFSNTPAASTFGGDPVVAAARAASLQVLPRISGGVFIRF
jgi:hypothetical protein